MFLLLTVTCGKLQRRAWQTSIEHRSSRRNAIKSQATFGDDNVSSFDGSIGEVVTVKSHLLRLASIGRSGRVQGRSETVAGSLNDVGCRCQTNEDEENSQE